GFWEGHLASWTITLAGEILDKNGSCALSDPDLGEGNNGPFIPGAPPHWDAASAMPAPGARNLSTSVLTSPGVSQKIDFTFPTVEETRLGLTATDVPFYPYPGTPAADENELAQMLVQNVRGCQFGTGFGATTCVTRPAVLGDIFHSAPVVIPRPPGASSSPSYNAFSATYSDRDRVIVAGANDGFFHIFHAGDWNAISKTYDAGTGSEIAGFMPYPARQNAKELPLDSGTRDQYFVDGSATVVDAWFYTNPTTNAKLTNGSEWRTVALSGMRQGGEAYFALDITDPSSTGYPGYLWEFPREDAPASISDYIGQTWSKPVVTRIRTSVNGDLNGGQGYERWVAIFGGGYDPASDPNDHAAYDPNATEGRAIVILDLKTGEIIATKKFDPVATDGQQDMLYAIPASPAVFDLDFDGFADVIYVGDLGGNVWKWALKGRDILDNLVLVEDVVNGTGSVDQPDLPFKKWFQAPVYDSGTNKYYKSFYNSPSGTLKNKKLFLVFGSGERSNLPFMGFTSTTDENNRLYSIMDLDPQEKGSTSLPTLTEADLSDLTTNTSCASLGTTRGFFLMGDDGEKFVTETDILFYYVFAISYRPLLTANPCETAGEVYLYAFKVNCGESLFEDTGGNPQIRIKLDESTPTTPTITVGDEVEIKTGSPDGVGGPPSPGLDAESADGQAYWRELRFGQDR
ncbi:MAG: pilus assembly protein, partial [Planctomycetota bacterium]